MLGRVGIDSATGSKMDQEVWKEWVSYGKIEIKDLNSKNLYYVIIIQGRVDDFSIFRLFKAILFFVN